MRAAPAEGGLGLGVAGDVGVEHLEGVEAEAALGVASLSARSGRGRGRVHEEVHAAVAVKVGDEELLAAAELGVPAGLAGELAVGRVVGEATAKESRTVAHGIVDVARTTLALPF